MRWSGSPQRGYTLGLSCTLPSNGSWGARLLMSRHDPTEVTRRHVFAQKGLSEKQEQARIVVLAGNLAGDKYAIDIELTFGRGDTANVKIDDTLVSRMHARIFQHENGSYVIEDLDSRNGTQVNGMAVARQVLTYGDRIQIGSCLLLFAHHDPMEEQVAQRRKLEAIGRLGDGRRPRLQQPSRRGEGQHRFPEWASGRDESQRHRCARSVQRHSHGGRCGDRDDQPVAWVRARGGAKSHRGRLDRALPPRRSACAPHIPPSISIEAHIDRGLKVTGDRGQLHQLLMNLLINARDAMPNGGKLKISAKKADRLDLEKAPLNPLVAHALITVEDTGVGMDDATRERAFDPFFTTKGHQVGAGLGLAAVYEIAKTHNGHITLHSVPNRGSEFQVVFPLTSKRPIVPTEPSLPAIRLPSTQLLIMLVDDEDVVRRSAGRVVRQSGHRVIFARSGEEALRIYNETQPRPDLVLMDLNMPGMTGGPRPSRN